MDKKVLKLAEQLLIVKAGNQTKWDRYKDMAESAIGLAETFYKEVNKRD